MGCLRSALSGRSEGTCFDLAGAGRAKRCYKCSSGHTCSPVPAPAQRAARELVAALEAKADKKVGCSFLYGMLLMLTKTIT